MPSLSGMTRVPGRDWRNPSTWHLRTRLVLVAMALLVAICGAVGLFSYASMDLFLTRQLDTQLDQASAPFERIRPAVLGRFGQAPRPPRSPGTGRRDAERTDSGRRSQQRRIPGRGRRRSRASPPPTTTVLLALTPSGVSVDRSLSAGAYRLTAARTPYGDVIVTGLPLAEKQNTLASLVWTMVVVSAGGLVLIGLAGTALIRRTMKPLEQLSEVATKVSRLPLDAGEVALGVRVPTSAAHPGTEVGSVGYALNKMLDNVSNALEARQESEMKVRQFVADASHELRTPLTAIRGYTELMRMTEHFTPDGERSLARVQSQSERMTTLVEDLLLLARLDEGQPLKISDVDLTQLAIETVSDEKVMAPDRIWQLELPDEPVVVRGDATQLHQVLANLLSNARKHTEPGTKVVTGVMRSADGSAVVTVTDNGSGIAPEFIGRVFARFARADASRTNPASNPAAVPADSAVATARVGSGAPHARPPAPFPAAAEVTARRPPRRRPRAPAGWACPLSSRSWRPTEEQSRSRPGRAARSSPCGCPPRRRRLNRNGRRRRKRPGPAGP